MECALGHYRQHRALYAIGLDRAGRHMGDAGQHDYGHPSRGHRIEHVAAGRGQCLGYTVELIQPNRDRLCPHL